MINLQLASCSVMCGVIWMVQLLIYPAFTRVNAEDFAKFHAHHSSRITWIVLPAMLGELSSAGFLLYQEPNVFWSLNLSGVVLLWLSTFFLSVPLHDRLGRGPRTQELVNKLVLTNWPRTVLWTLRTFALLLYLNV